MESCPKIPTETIMGLVRIATYRPDRGSIAAVDWPQRSDLLFDEVGVLPWQLPWATRGA